jgi:hypothetical protein
MFDVQVLAMFTGPQGKSLLSGASVLHHYHGVQITVSILPFCPLGQFVFCPLSERPMSKTNKTSVIPVTLW